jgi:hypothetical protein
LFRTSGADAGGGFDEFVADPEAQQIAVEVDIAARTGVMNANRYLLPGHPHDAFGADFAADPSPVSGWASPMSTVHASGCRQ